MTPDDKADLFAPYHLQQLALSNRIVMAPMTRARASQPGDLPSLMNARYYAQRASAGLIISEASQISAQGKGYSLTPGIYSEAQVQGWAQVTEAVHAAGGRIMLQLWHVGRMSHTDFHQGELPVAPSAIAPDASIWMINPNTGQGQMYPCPQPRALETEEIAAIVEDYRRAAGNAIRAGFDGVEIHAANGYLIDQFLRTSSNTRTDQYGGSRANRLRFLQQVCQAVIDEVGAARTGIRLAPFLKARGMDCPDILPTLLEAAEWLNQRKIAYLHLVEADWDDAPGFAPEFRQAVRQRFSGTIMVAGNYDLPKAEAMLASGLADLIAFGRPFIANPDLVLRLHHGLPLNALDASSLFGGDQAGYLDYPASRAA